MNMNICNFFTCTCCVIAFYSIAFVAAAPVPTNPLLSLRPGTWWEAPNSLLTTSGVAPSPLNYSGLLVDFRQMFGDTGGVLDPRRSLFVFPAIDFPRYTTSFTICYDICHSILQLMSHYLVPLVFSSPELAQKCPDQTTTHYMHLIYTI
jgi:hypothetical protein